MYQKIGNFTINPGISPIPGMLPNPPLFDIWIHNTMGALLIVIATAAFLLGYLFYSKRISTWLGVEPDRPTPAHTERDDFDYCPARTPVLFGHHFSSIAGAAPIVGPIFGAVFGWLPVFLWIVIGGIFAGAVHDFSSLIASIRHRGCSIGEVIEAQIGRTGKTLFLLFSWSALILVVAVFDIIVANTFERIPAAATTGVLYVGLAVCFGIANYRLKTPFVPTTAVFVVLLFVSIGVGMKYPVSLTANVWKIVLLGYIFIASVLPVWLLLQPRDYLSSFLLYTLIAGATFGILFTNPAMNLPVFTGMTSSLGYLFPILFVTVACGAISGFHSLVASGTTAKQLNRESDARIIGYGGMLIECLLAVIALVAAGFFLPGEYRELLGQGGNGPIEIFSRAVGSFLATLRIPAETGATFAALTVSAFALTTLDTATRLSRYAFQEFFGGSQSSRLACPTPGGSPAPSFLGRNCYFATLTSVAAAALLIFTGSSSKIWPVFGSANQLLAALAFLAVATWLSRIGRKYSFLLVPMFFMFAVTFSALILLSYRNLCSGHILLGVISLVLLVLSIALSWQAYQVLGKKKSP